MISTSWEILQHKWCQRVISHWNPGMTFLSPCSSIHARSLPTKRPCRCCWEKQQRLFAAREELLRYWPFCSNSSTILGKLWTEKIIMGREFEKWCRESQHIINCHWLNVILAMRISIQCQYSYWCSQEDGLFQFKAYQLSTILSFPSNIVCIVVIKELKWKIKSLFPVERNDKRLKLRIKSLFFSRRKDQWPAQKRGALRSHLQSTFAEQKLIS